VLRARPGSRLLAPAGGMTARVVVFVLYIIGSLCFLAGSVLSLWLLLRDRAA
jgi:hypothetical protein